MGAFENNFLRIRKYIDNAFCFISEELGGVETCNLHSCNSNAHTVIAVKTIEVRLDVAWVVPVVLSGIFRENFRK